jgi:hypothetical protein
VVIGATVSTTNDVEAVSDFSSGFGSTISGGLTQNINTFLGNDAVINNGSVASQIGNAAGIVYNTVLEITPGSVALRKTLRYMGYASQGFDAIKDGYKTFHGAITGNAQEAFEGVMGLSKSSANVVAELAMGKNGLKLKNRENKFYGGFFSQGLDNISNAITNAFTPKDSGRKFEPDRKGINFGIVQGRPTSLIDQVRGQSQQVSRE